MADPSVTGFLKTALGGPASHMIDLSVGGILKALGLGKEVRRVGLTQDESYQDNVDWIKKHVGEDVEISHDMPPIHETCGLVKPTDDQKDYMITKMDAAMQAATAKAISEVKKEQARSEGYISWKQLQRIFDSQEQDIYHPMNEHDISRSDYAYSTCSMEFSVKMSPDDLMKAEQSMKATINDDKVWNMLEIDTEKIKEIFSERSVWATNFGDLFYQAKKAGHVAIDIGVVRFPRMEDPFFKLYRFRVLVFNSKERLFWLNSHDSGIVCEYNVRQYSMTKKWSAQFDEESEKKVKAKFASIMEEFFS